MSTLGTIRANVRRNLGEASEQFYLNADLNVFIGQAFQNAYDVMITEGVGYFETSTLLAIVANQEAYDMTTLDPVFVKVSALERNTTIGTIPCRYSERRFEPNLTYYRGAMITYQPTYKMRGTDLILEPSPPASEAGTTTTGFKLDYVYVPEFPVFDSDDTFVFDASFPTFYEPLVILDATIQALESKDGMGGVSDISSFRKRYEDWYLKFTNSLNREEYPDSVAYVGQRYNDWPYEG